jgi:phage-related protein
MKWEIVYYNTNVQEAILKWPKKMLQRYLRIVDLIGKGGPDLGMPFTKSIEKGLFEIRVKAQEGIGRAFFCYLVKSKIIILHSFIKKTQKTPKKEVDITRRRMKEVIKNGL